MTSQLTVVPPETSTASESTAPTVAPDVTNEGIELARGTHANLQDMVKVADAKATTLVALHTLILGGGLAVLEKLEPSWVVGLFFLASMFSLFSAGWVIKPRFPLFPDPKGCRGLLWIKALPSTPEAFEKYAAALASTTRQQLLSDLAFENTKIANLLKTKFRWLGLAIHALFAALALFMLLLAFNLFKKGIT